MSTRSTDGTALMRVRVVLSIDVDPDAWMEVYGKGDETRAAIREDVRDYAWQQVAGSAAAEESVIRRVAERS